MPRSLSKSLAFPLAGVSRRGPHRQQYAPFTCPWAVNVRTVGPSEQRKRGGSRPGLSKHCASDLGNVTSILPITYIDGAGSRQHDLLYVADGVLGYVQGGTASATTAELEGPDGVDILDDNNVTIDFVGAVSSGTLQGVVRGGAAYFADSTLKKYSPATGVVETVLATTDAAVPTSQTVIALYRDRIFLAGATNDWYASRVGDPGDWDYGAAMEDPGRAWLGQLSVAGRIGGVVTAMIPVSDQLLVMATENTLWALQGDPTTGRLERLSDSVGVISPRAWAKSPDGTVVFLSNDGVYVFAPGQGVTRFSAERVPDELREVDTSTITVSMAYDPVGRGYHLFLTPASPTIGTHWWIDLENRAFWPQRFSDDHQPLDAACMSDEGLGRVVLACRDGYIREVDEDEYQDDGTNVESHVLLGPVRLPSDDVHDAMLSELAGAVEGLTANTRVVWRVVSGRSAADAAERALADLESDLDGKAPSFVSASGLWGEGRSKVARPRSRGPWLVLWLSSVGAWSYESVAVVAAQLGRLR